MPRMTKEGFLELQGVASEITASADQSKIQAATKIAESLAAIQVRLIVAGQLNEESFEITDSEITSVLMAVITYSTLIGQTLPTIDRLINILQNLSSESKKEQEAQAEAARLESQQEAEKAAELAKQEAEKSKELEGFPPRNELEKLLINKHFPVVELYKNTIATITREMTEREKSSLRKEYYDTLRAFIYSQAFYDKQTSITLLEAKVPKLSDVGWNVEVYGGAVKKTISSVLEEGAKKIPKEEMQYAESSKKSSESEIFLYDALIDADTTYVNQYTQGEKPSGAVYSFQGLRSMFPESGSGGDVYKAGALEVLFNLPVLYYRDYVKYVENGEEKERVEWKRDNESLGQKIYNAFRETIARSYGIQIVPGEDYADELNDLSTYIEKVIPIDKDPAPSKLYSAMLPDDKGGYEQFKLKSRGLDKSKSHLPFKESVRDDELKDAILMEITRNGAIDEFKGPSRSSLRSNAAYVEQQKNIPNRSSNYHYDEVAAVLGAIAIPDITLMSAWADRKLKDSGGIDVEAATAASRVFNYLRIARKYTKIIMGQESGSDGDPSKEFVADMNPGLMMDSISRPFFQYFGYDGRTFEWHILKNGDPNNVRWSELPGNAFKEYSSQISHHLAPVEAVLEASVNLAGIAKFNKESGALEAPDAKTVQKVIGLIRKLVDYGTGHESPDKVQKDGDSQNAKENPTGDFIAIEVYDINSSRSSDGGYNPSAKLTPNHSPSSFAPSREKAKQHNAVFRYVTRMHTLYPMYGQHFYEWIPASLKKGVKRGWEFHNETLTDEQRKNGEISKTIKLYINSSGLTAPISEANPSKLLERELVFRFFAGLLYPGQGQSELSEKDMATIMLMVGSLGKELIEERWTQGPIPYMATRAGLKLMQIPILGDLVKKNYGAITSEVGNFSRRATYYMDRKTGDDQIGYLVNRINPEFNRFEKATDAIKGLWEFLSETVTAPKK